MVKQVEQLEKDKHRKSDPIQLAWMVNQVGQLSKCRTVAAQPPSPTGQARGGRVSFPAASSHSALFTIRTHSPDGIRYLCNNVRVETHGYRQLSLRDRASAMRSGGTETILNTHSGKPQKRPILRRPGRRHPPLDVLDQAARRAAFAVDECEGKARMGGPSGSSKTAGFAVLLACRPRQP